MSGSTDSGSFHDKGQRAASILVGISFVIVAFAVVAAIVLAARY